MSTTSLRSQRMRTYGPDPALWSFSQSTPSSPSRMCCSTTPGSRTLVATNVRMARTRSGAHGPAAGELHALADLEGPGLAVRGQGPRLGHLGHHLDLAAHHLQIDQLVIQLVHDDDTLYLEDHRRVEGDKDRGVLPNDQ